MKALAGLLSRLAGRGGDRSSGAAARYVPAPHPDWTPGTPLPPPYGSTATKTLEPATVGKAAMYPFMISAVVPRPIALVSSISPEGVVNLAPYSYFNAMGHYPPVVAIGIARSPPRGGGKKDTLTNIEASGEFVVHIISDWYLEAANHASGEYEPGVDELALSGLTPVPSTVVKPPRVAEAAVQLECKLRHIHEVNDAAGNPASAVVIGEVVMVHVHEGVTTTTPSGNVIVDPIKLQPMSRLGGVLYARTTELIDMPRPDGKGNYPPRKG